MTNPEDSRKYTEEDNPWDLLRNPNEVPSADVVKKALNERVGEQALKSQVVESPDQVPSTTEVDRALNEQTAEPGKGYVASDPNIEGALNSPNDQEQPPIDSGGER